MSGLGRLAGRSLAVCDEGKCCRTRHVLRSLSKLGEALDAFPLLYERPSEERPGRSILRIDLQGLRELSDGGSVIPLKEVMPGEVPVDQDGQGLQPEGRPDLLYGLVLAAHRVEVVGIPMVSCGVLWVELDGLLEPRLGRRPVPIVEEESEREGRVGLREIRIEAEGLERRFV